MNKLTIPHVSRSTPREQTLARNIVANAGRVQNLKELLTSSGYSIGSAKTVGRILTQRGVQDELIRLGFNEQAAKARVAEILYHGKDEHSLKASELIFKVFGSFAPEKSVNLNVFAAVLQEIANEDSGIVIKNAD